MRERGNERANLDQTPPHRRAERVCVCVCERERERGRERKRERERERERKRERKREVLVRSGRPLQIDECASEQALSMKRRATYYTDAFAYMYVYVRMYVRASTRASQSARFRILVNVWMNCIVDLLAGEHAYIYVYVYVYIYIHIHTRRVYLAAPLAPCLLSLPSWRVSPHAFNDVPPSLPPRLPAPPAENECSRRVLWPKSHAMERQQYRCL